ncbi:hypothetical protein BC831DRAFT_433872 [Entophlyctis helioformis]|nr:hypothetical protein BC831DRAFT_433872 [Entophlyctis helioformis]
MLTDSDGPSAPSAPATAPGKRAVSFKQVVAVSFTWHKDDYDRSSIDVSPLTRPDIWLNAAAAKAQLALDNSPHSLHPYSTFNTLNSMGGYSGNPYTLSPSPSSASSFAAPSSAMHMFEPALSNNNNNSNNSNYYNHQQYHGAHAFQQQNHQQNHQQHYSHYDQHPYYMDDTPSPVLPHNQMQMHYNTAVRYAEQIPY